MESNKSIDFKSYVTNLTNLPPSEFEKYFQDWMERDDIARSLQAKLRSDLIKNFNKTKLGKHILSHTVTSHGGSTMRLTLSPLILALNTLVAEFLYAQNCHFTLSVFCTEIPFRSTLPDFESMERFRFNSEEISEIWQAVTGFKANKGELNKNVIQYYERNPSMSLLLLIIKYLLKKDPLEQLKRNAEVQTEIQEKSHKSISAQASDQERKSNSKAKAKDNNLFHINKYLLTLSDKVIEMTKEFEQFSKQRRESRPRTLRSSRSREYHTLNKSLERITENMKTMAQTKRRNKRLSNVIESIDNLTHQFGKCAQNFNNVTKFLGSKEEMFDIEKPGCAKVKLKEKQTGTELLEKSYNDWIHEMRNTENGKKFLNRVEISLRKALAKHRQELQSETDIKMKRLKCLIKLHYQQKLAKHLLQVPKIHLEETRRCNDNIEKKLQQFERKHMELLQKLQESSFELKEAQLEQKDNSTITEEDKIPEKVYDLGFENILNEGDKENYIKNESKSCELHESQNLEMKNINISQFDPKSQHDKNSSIDSVTKEDMAPFSVRDVSKTQEQILDIAQNIAEQGRSVDKIIYDAKLRIQKLEIESNQLEQNFQSYLERRKQSQEKDSNNQNIPKICSHLNTLYRITSARLIQERKKSSDEERTQKDDIINEEFQRLRETLKQNQESTNVIPKTAKSDSSTSSLEIKNAILEAKLKFFEHEHIIRKCKEQEDQIRNGNLLEKEFVKYAELQELENYIDNDRVELNLESSLSELNIKDKTLDEEQNIDLSPMTEHKSQKTEDEISISARRELFPNDLKVNASKTSGQGFQPYASHHKPATVYNQNLKDDLKGENVIQNTTKKSDTSTKLIEQSMTKMQQLFEQHSKSQETLREMVNDLKQNKILQEGEPKSIIDSLLRPNGALDKSLTTTIEYTTKANEETEVKTHRNILESITSISNTSVPPLFNSSCESVASVESNHHDIEMTLDVVKEKQPTTKESKEFESTTTKKQLEVGQLIESSSSSSEVISLSSPNKSNRKSKIKLQQEFGYHNQSLKFSDLNLHSPSIDKEIGEIFVETDRTFAPIDSKLDENFSSESSSDFEISTGCGNNDAKNLGSDNESDFWD